MTVEIESIWDAETRQCGTCNQVKPMEEFAWRNKAKGTRNWACRDCQKAYRKQHYEANRERYIAKAAKWRNARLAENRIKVRHYLETHPCVDCGEEDWVVLDFDHREMDDKEFSIAETLQFQFWDKIQAEIEKCDIRCANCHRRRTARQLGQWRASAVLAYWNGTWLPTRNEQGSIPRYGSTSMT